MDKVSIYTNKQNMMDFETAKKTILSIAHKFHINHIDFLCDYGNYRCDGEETIPCEIQIEPYLDSENGSIDFEKATKEFKKLYGRQYAYFEKSNNITELNAFMIRLKREYTAFVELGQLYKILNYHKQKYEFAKSQGISISKDIFDELLWLRKNALKLLPGCTLREIDYKYHFDTNNRTFRLREYNRQQAQLFEENKNRTVVNYLKQITNINYRLDYLLKLPDPSSIETNEAESLKKKLIALEKELKKNQNDKYKKTKYLPEEKYDIEKKKLVIIENKKCEKIVAQTFTSLHSENNIRNIQRYSEDPEHFNEEHYLKMGFFFPAMAAFKKNEEEKSLINKLIETECAAFKFKFNTDYSPSKKGTSTDFEQSKKKIDDLYEQLKKSYKNESYPETQVILKYCEKNKIDIKNVISF